jgi:hypothetical protein
MNGNLCLSSARVRERFDGEITENLNTLLSRVYLDEVERNG